MRFKRNRTEGGLIRPRPRKRLDQKYHLSHTRLTKMLDCPPLLAKNYFIIISLFQTLYLNATHPLFDVCV
jgi:hypothetical protein